MNQKGFDAIHTFDLPSKNKTSDFQIAQLAIAENRIVVTKDVDFLDSFLIKGEPTKPIMVKTANLTNRELILIFEKNIVLIADMIGRSNLVEVSQSHIAEHA